MGLGLGLCCCGCATCGGILDDPTLSVIGGAQLLVAGIYDLDPTTTDYATHFNQLIVRSQLIYQPTFSTATMQIFSGAIGTRFRVTLRLEDGVAPIVSVATNATGGIPSMSSGLIGDLGGNYGAVFACDDTATGWTLIDYRNRGGFFYQMMVFEGVYISCNTTGGFIPALPVPDSWCCPNGNADANGDGGCGEATEAPDTAVLTVAGFVTDPGVNDWSVLNGDFTLTKTAEATFSDYYVGTYASATQTADTCDWLYTGSIVVPKVGSPSVQCGAAIGFGVLSGVSPCFGSTKPFVGLQSTVTLAYELEWKWSPLGCQFGYFVTSGGGYYMSRGTPSTIGRPTRLAW